MANSYMLEMEESISVELIRDIFHATGYRIEEDEKNTGSFWAFSPENDLVAYCDTRKNHLSADEYRDEGWRISACVAFSIFGEDMAIGNEKIKNFVHKVAARSNGKFVLTWMFETTYAIRGDSGVLWVSTLP